MLNITAARRSKQKTVDLNITPLIDMVFILLIFFLVTTSFVRETGVDVDRPTAATAVRTDGSPLLIGITADNAVYMNRHRIDINAVTVHVERALAENPGSNVVIVADTQSSTGIVVRIMDACRLAGAEHISLAAGHP